SSPGAGAGPEGVGAVIEVISFGFGHAPAPRAELVVDLRSHFRDPHVHQTLRQLTGLDDEVRNKVIRTPG
ncbi:hypothetical protein KBZ21_54395, partial [Streptomyces sp. A73]|nr:hypothetical protein [Streptomyces sp. A73]